MDSKQAGGRESVKCVGVVVGKCLSVTRESLHELSLADSSRAAVARELFSLAPATDSYHSSVTKRFCG